jgi:hypothetical protein
LKRTLGIEIRLDELLGKIQKSLPEENDFSRKVVKCHLGVQTAVFCGYGRLQQEHC